MHACEHACIHPGLILSRLLLRLLKFRCAFAFWTGIYFAIFDQKERNILYHQKREIVQVSFFIVTICLFTCFLLLFK